MKYLYLIIDLTTVVVPFIFSFHPRLRFFQKWKFAWPAILITAAIFLAWDAWFTRIGVWSFNPDYITGLYYFGLPVEEILFFICIPYSCLFSYHCLKTLLFPHINLKSMESFVSYTLSIVLVVLMIIADPRLYSTITFVSLAGIILLLKIVFRVSWIGRFYFVFLVMLLPFMIVNGILTGTGPDAPVVIYNNLENLGIRILTIPIEDFFYGMLFQLLNVALFEFFIWRHE